MAVPYSQFDDPQSLNLYGYVRNNPITRIDADGHDGFTFLGIPIVYPRTTDYGWTEFKAEYAHEIEHSKTYFTGTSIAQTEKKAFAAEAKVYEARVKELQDKQANGGTLSKRESKELQRLQTEKLPTAQNNSTSAGAQAYVNNTNPGADPNKSLAGNMVDNAAKNVATTIVNTVVPVINAVSTVVSHTTTPPPPPAPAPPPTPQDPKKP